MAFHVGQKVVCVRQFRKCPDGEVRPIKGETYTIREFDTPDKKGLNYIRLNEIINAPRDYKEGYGEASWWTGYFRPVQERKQSTETGMTILRKLLNTKKVDA